MPGGVNSPVRSFASVGGTPRFISRGEGPYLWDVDGNRYVDYVQSWGPLVLGHAHPAVTRALNTAIARGTSFGAPTALEVELADLLVGAFPAVEMVRLVNSGTEATMSAVRLARAFTGRDKIVKFAGAYHGHGDGFLAAAGSGVSTLGLPDSPGVPREVASKTIVAVFNDLSVLRSVFKGDPAGVAAVITEPLLANTGFVRPVPGFLAGVQDLCREFGALFILDEVITGFRVGMKGAQGLWDLDPDLTCMGKVIGGGLPLGAFGGRRAIMEHVAPSGPVYQAGTLSGNPLATSAGIATLKTLLDSGALDEVSRRTRTLVDGVGQLAARHGLVVQVDCEGSIFGLFFLKKVGAEIFDYATAKEYADVERYSRFFHAMLGEGFYFAPSQFEVAFVSAVHTDDVVEQTLRAFDRAFGGLTKEGVR